MSQGAKGIEQLGAGDAAPCLTAVKSMVNIGLDMIVVQEQQRVVSLGARGIEQLGAGDAAAAGAHAVGAEISPKHLKEMLTYPPDWGPTQWVRFSPVQPLSSQCNEHLAWPSPILVAGQLLWTWRCSVELLAVPSCHVRNIIMPRETSALGEAKYIWVACLKTIAPWPTCRGPFHTCRIQMCWFGAWRTSGDPWTGIAASRAPPKVYISQIVPGLGMLFAKSPGKCTTRRRCSLQLGSSRTRSCNLEAFAWPQFCVVHDRS